MATCLSGTNPYWDLKRYMKNLENGFQIAFFTFLNGRQPSHIRVRDVYDSDSLAAHCDTAIDGGCSSAGSVKWPWADPEALEVFYADSVKDIRSDDERYASITPEPVLNYHGVTEIEIEEFTSATVQAVAREEDQDTLPAKGEQRKRKRKRCVSDRADGASDISDKKNIRSRRKKIYTTSIEGDSYKHEHEQKTQFIHTKRKRRKQKRADSPQD